MADCKIVAPYRNLYMPPWPEWSSKELSILQIRSAYHYASASLHLSYSVCIAAVYSKKLNGRGISNAVTSNNIKNWARVIAPGITQIHHFNQWAFPAITANVIKQEQKFVQKKKPHAGL